MTDTPRPGTAGRWDRFLAEWSFELKFALGVLFIGLSLVMSDDWTASLERIVLAVLGLVLVVRLGLAFLAGYRGDA